MDIKAVAFDLDGTLYPNYRMYLLSVGFAFRHPYLVYCFNEVRKEIRKVRPVDDFKTLQRDLLAKRMGVPPERADELIEKKIYQAWEQSLKRLRTYPFLKDVLVALREDGYKLAVMSDFPVLAKLGFLGLDDLWDTAFCTEDTGYLKPNPEPFMELAKRLDCEPSSILYVGNSYSYDIIGAHNAGLRSAHLTKRPPSGSVADFSFSSYPALLEWIRERKGT
ncbi:HAD family hydrolase [Spirochaetia bacterium 38H-sp]|uniref:HAD family hydrolase n=1 Tax=Rarispira pelagica TaxID=3141764 RepID=A0ABU9UDS5_9SPIR